MKLSFRAAGKPPTPETDQAERLADEFQARVEQAFAPDPEALDRIRTRALAEFRRSPREGAARPPAWRQWLALPRPLVASALALGVVAASAGLVAAYSGPAEPFYGVRLAAEEMLLPSSGPARVLDELARLDMRLAEAQAAARQGDAMAATAALDAYRNELAATVTEVGASGADFGPVLEALTHHETVLTNLSSVVPPAALGGLNQAVDQTTRAVERLRTMPGGMPPEANPGANPTGTPGMSTAPGPNRSPHPTPPLSPPGQSTHEPLPAATPSVMPPSSSHMPSHGPGRP